MSECHVLMQPHAACEATAAALTSLIAEPLLKLPSARRLGPSLTPQPFLLQELHRGPHGRLAHLSGHTVTPAVVRGTVEQKHCPMDSSKLVASVPWPKVKICFFHEDQLTSLCLLDQSLLRLSHSWHVSRAQGQQTQISGTTLELLAHNKEGLLWLPLGLSLSSPSVSLTRIFCTGASKWFVC